MLNDHPDSEEQWSHAIANWIIRIAAVTGASLCWFVVWIRFIVMPVSQTYGDRFGFQGDLFEPENCLRANVVRAILYVVLFGGFMALSHFMVKRQPSGARNAADQLKALETSKPNSGNTPRPYARVLGAVMVWITFWSGTSQILYAASATHFMWDCDRGDFECWCDNWSYLFPVFLITLLAGAAYLTVLITARPVQTNRAHTEA